MADINLGNLYDFNKEAMKNENPLDPIQFNLKTNEIAVELQEREESQYWMLLCHERRDYTIFNIIACQNHKDIERELKPTLLNRGTIISIEKQPDENWEIWIRDSENENFVYYLFPYDNGVIEINE
jgi:hypothetical protein